MLGMRFVSEYRAARVGEAGESHTEHPTPLATQLHLEKSELTAFKRKHVQLNRTKKAGTRPACDHCAKALMQIP
mgnify:CR=1 FL=1